MIRVIVSAVFLVITSAAFGQDQKTDTSRTPQPALMEKLNGNPAKPGKPMPASPAAAAAEADPAQPGTPAEPKAEKSEAKKPETGAGDQ